MKCIKKPKKLKKRTTIREDAGKLLLDIGKSVFGSIFLGGVLRGEIPQIILIIAGFAVTALTCLAGLFLVVKEENTGEPRNPPETQE